MRDTGSFKILKVFGIDIRIHVSLIVLLFYFFFIISASFPTAARNAGVDPSVLTQGPLYWSSVFAFGLLASILLHELGHALVAQSFGIRVHSITLMMLGGISAIEKPPEKRYLEFKLAVAGPLVSFTIAAVMGIVHTLAESSSVLFFSHWLATTNLVLGVFNLLPAFPLDGGRALRSLLAAKRGNMRATQILVKLSKGFAVVLGLLALISFNLILGLIAFFIYSASQGEQFFLLSQGLLSGLRVGEFALQTATVLEGQKLSEVSAKMLKYRNTVLPVQTFTGVPAIVTLSQIMSVPKSVWENTRVEETMERVSGFVEANDFLSQILPQLMSAPGGVLPVREKGSIIGILRFSDLSEILELRTLQEELPFPGSQLPPRSEEDERRTA
jgi:Zn-dependent protease